MIKWLKKLFIGLLIWLPILSVSFTNAYDKPGNYTVSSVGSLVWNPYQVWVFSKWNVITEYWWVRRFVFAPASNVLFFWDNNQLPRLIIPKTYSCLTNWVFRYYRKCSEIVDWVAFNEDSCGSFELLDQNYLSDFMRNVDSNTDNYAYYYREGSQGANSIIVCFSSHKKWESVCFWIVNSTYYSRCFQPNPADNPYPSNMFTWGSLEYTFDSLPESYIWKSPAWTYTSIEDSDYEVISSTLTNYDVLVWCEKAWLSTAYCKWWYDVSVLFPDSWFPSLANYVRWQWVDILTMYNMYSWTYNSPNMFMSAIAHWYNIYDYDWFRWKPLALYMFAVQYFPNKDDLQFSFMDIYNYCKLFDDVDKWLENNIYTDSWLTVCKNQARLDKLNNFGNWITSDWSGALSIFWNWTWFTDPEEFFWKIYSFFNTNLIYDWESFPWVLPPVIYFFLIAIIFIRIISRSNG